MKKFFTSENKKTFGPSTEYIYRLLFAEYLKKIKSLEAEYIELSLKKNKIYTKKLNSIKLNITKNMNNLAILFMEKK